MSAGSDPSGFLGTPRSLRERTAAATRAASAVVVLATVLSAVGLLDADGAGAQAVSPVVSRTSEHVTADALPTVQVNGVVWDQEVVGDTVYAVGAFTRARPAGSPAGSNEVVRNNILAYDISTGALRTGFVASLNGQARAVAASPDGSRIYIGGEFTNVNGLNRWRIAALDPATGALITSFNAAVDYRVNSLAASDTTVYAGGAFNNSGSSQRRRLAAFSATNGALLSGWNPNADAEVHAIVLGAGGTRLFVGGRFQNVGGTAQYGLAAVDADSGAVLPWAANTVVRNAGTSSAILSLVTDGARIYGSGYHYGSGGNLEGAFSADPITGEIYWVQDCHGDTYDVAPVNSFLYTVSHAHYCQNVGGFPQSSPWGINGREAISFTLQATGTVQREMWNYANWQGRPSPSMVNWFPDLDQGSYTGLNQAAWTVEGNSDYVVLGGEFPRVNGQGQQGLVRFARRPIAPGASGPRLGGSALPVKLQSLAAGQVRVTLPANWDRDDKALTYRIVRDGATVHETTVESTYWDRPTIAFTDTALAPGSNPTYQVRTSDPDGNVAWSDSTSITVSGSGSPSAYSDTVMNDGARMHWRLGDPAGSPTAADAVGFRDANRSGGASFGASGAILGESGTAASLTNSASSTIVDPTLSDVQNELSVEIWFRTTSSTGGRLIGFANTTSGSSTRYDRMLYLTNNGRVVFGSHPFPAAIRTVESQSGLNNGQWHHVVGTMGSEGMHLYVDGVRVASRADPEAMVGRGYNGYWRIGSDTLAGWPSRPSTDYLTATVDEPAIYHRPLTASEVADHYTASGRTPNLGSPPGDAYGSTVRAANPYLYYRLSEASGSVANDTGIRRNHGDYFNSVGRGAGGVIPTNAAAQFTGSGHVADRTAIYNPAGYSLEAWFNTTTGNGGSIIGFGDSQSSATSTTSDRQVHMRNDGRLSFRVLNPSGNGTTTITSPVAYNDGSWHHVVATQGSGGMTLYVDGVAVATSPLATARAYSGYWKVGRESTAGGSSAAGFSGRIDEVAVYDRVLGAGEVHQHLALGGGEVPNLAPVADFAVTTSELTASFDASASTDVDGTITSYAWEFGDGNTGTGQSASHTYATPGSYTVTLTVTDDDGATAQATRTVNVSEPPPNQAPSAAFSAQQLALAVSVDASGSTDVDGTITSYAWEFGDGNTATGQSASHTYAQAGTYTITLTVTDDDGATAQASSQVTVGPIAVHAADAFERTVDGGLGAADVGGPWALGGPAGDFSVAGGQGLLRVPSPGQTRSASLTPPAPTDVESTVTFTLDKAPTGGGMYVSSVLREVGSSEYRLRIRVQPTATTLQLMRVLNGAETVVAAQNLAGITYTAGTPIHLRFRATGSGTTTLEGKAWLGAAQEPATWQIQATDTTAALQSATGVGVHVYSSGSTTNSPVTLGVDNLSVMAAV